MSRSFLRTIFILVALGVLLFNINEYLKHTEKKAIETYLAAIQSTLAANSLKINAAPVLCRGFIQHKCEITSIRIYGGGLEMELQNASAKIANISPKSIGVEFSVAKIKQNQALFPTSLSYKLHLTRDDSRLGFVALNRSLYLDFADFSLAARLEVLLRDESFKHKNVLFLLKEWFDTATPSFFEYSLDSLDVKIDTKASQIAQRNEILALISQYKAQNERLFATPKIAAIESAIAELLDGKTKSAMLNIKRKNPNLAFFKTLNTESQKKKSLEIAQVLYSIDDGYVVNLEVE